MNGDEDIIAGIVVLFFAVVLVTAITSLIWGWPADMTNMTWPDQ